MAEFKNERPPQLAASINGQSQNSLLHEILDHRRRHVLISPHLDFGNVH